MIYTTRNPKDSILSLYKLLLWFRQFDGVESPFKTFFNMFMKGEESKDSRYCKALIYEPRSDIRDLLAIKFKSEIFTGKERPNYCEQ